MLWCFLLLSTSAGLRSGDFRGQIVEKGSLAPIENATVVLDQQSPLAIGAHSDRTTIFGFFEFRSVPAGAYRVRVHRGGYLPFDEPFLIAASPTNRVIELTPGGTGNFDVSVSVADVMTGIPIPGVRLITRRFNTGAGDDGQDLPPQLTDALGATVFEGLSRGFYGFRTEVPPGWQPYQSPKQLLLEKHQHVTFLLKADRGDLTVAVTGFDPVTEAEGPLPKVFVDVTGLDPGAISGPGQATKDIPIALSTRSGYTDDGVPATFGGLPVVLPYRLALKKLGYQKHDEILPSGQLSSITRRMVLKDYRLRVELEQDWYLDARVLEGLEVRLEGLEHTNTEGIKRQKTSGTAPNERLFTGLLPGRYRLEVHGRGTGAGIPVAPVFQAVDYVEIIQEGLTELSLPLKLVTARIYGRLFAAETKVKSPKAAASDIFFLRPKYTSKTAQDIQLVEAEADGLLLESKRRTRVDTDANGFFTMEVAPARYGVLILTLSNYWGSHVLFTEVTPKAVGYPQPPPVTGGDEVDPVGDPVLPTVARPSPLQNMFPAEGQGWPNYRIWPADWGAPPRNGTPNPGYPLVVGDGEHHLDLFLRREGLSIGASISAVPSPTDRMIVGRDPEFGQHAIVTYHELGDGGGVATLISDDGSPPLTTPIVGREPVWIDEGSGFASGDTFNFPLVRPGQHTLGLTHPRFTFRAQRFSLGGGGANISADISWLMPGWTSPGVRPARNPTDFDQPEAMAFTPPGGTASFASPLVFFADYKRNTVPLTLRFHRWVEESEEPDFQPRYELRKTEVSGVNGNASFIEFLTVSYAPGRIFTQPSVLPDGAFQFWVRYGGGIFKGSGSGGHDFYLGGPQDNQQPEDDFGDPAELHFPSVPADPGVLVRAVAKSDPDTIISGLKIVFGATGSPNLPLPLIRETVTSGQFTEEGRPTLITLIGEPVEILPNTEGWTGLLTGDSIRTSTTNVPTFESEIRISTNPFPLRVVTVFVKRGLIVFGQVRAKVPPNPPPAPVPAPVPVSSGTVQIRDRFGMLVREVVVNQRGRWSIRCDGKLTELIQGGEPFYVEVASPGYQRFRQRVTASSITTTGDAPKAEVNVVLEPLPRPTIVRNTFDRRGTFLPGVSYESGPSFFQRADEDLTLTWTVDVRSEPTTYELIGFESEDGTIETNEVVTVKPRPQEVFLVGQLGFVGNPFNQDTKYIWNLPGNLNVQNETRSWLRDVLSGAAPRVFHEGAFPPEIQDVGNGVTLYKYRGATYLWQLPPGRFRPLIAVRDAFGGLTVHTPFGAVNPADESTATVPFLLEGVRMPEWLASAANRVALVAGLQKAGNTVEIIAEAQQDTEPEGRFQSLPQVGVTIETVESPTVITGNPLPGAAEVSLTYLRYIYDLEVRWKEGLDQPGRGWLKLVGGVVGLDLIAAAQMGLDGSSKDQQFFLDLEGSTTTARDAATLARRQAHLKRATLPVAFRNSFKDFLQEPTLRVSAHGAIRGNFDPDRLEYAFQVDTAVGGGVELGVQVPLTPLFAAVPPPVGPVMINLDKSKVLETYATFEAGVGAAVETSFATVFPSSIQPGQDQVSLRTFLGGLPLNVATPKLTLGVRADVGLVAEALAGRGRLSASIAIEGDEHPLIQFPALTLEGNLDGDWPPFKRLKGHVGAHLNASLDLWVTSLAKEWSWTLLPINVELGTDPVFDIQPVNVAVRIVTPAQANPPTLDTSKEALVEDFYPTGSFDLASGERGGALVFAGIHPVSGKMTVEVSLRSEGAFSAPVRVAEASAITATAITPLLQGGWLAVWNELDAAQALSPYPTQSVLRYATSDPTGSQWSMGQGVKTIAGVISEVHLLPIADTPAESGAIAMAARVSNAGPGSSLASVLVGVWTAGGWNELAIALPEAPLGELQVVPFGSTALGAVLNEAQGVTAFTWDRSGANPPSLIVPNGVQAFALTPSSPGTVATIWADVSGDLRVTERGFAASQWSVPRTIQTGVLASDLAVAPLQGTTGFALAWISPAAPNEVAWAVLDSTLSMASDSVSRASSVPGIFVDLAIVEATGAGVRILARHRGASASLRQMVLPEPPHPSVVRLLNPAVATAVEFLFSLDAAEGTTVQLEYSTDLKSWQRLEQEPLRSFPATVRLPITVQPAGIYYRGVVVRSR